MVEAPDVEVALDKTKALIHKLKAEEGVLDDVSAVFLELCVEVGAIGEVPVKVRPLLSAPSS